MSKLIDAILEFSRVIRTELHRTEVDLTQVANAILTQCKSGSVDRDVETTIAKKRVALGDQCLFKILLENLICNAWKYAGGRT